MTDLLTDLLIYIGIGIIMFTIGIIAGYQLLIMYYTRRFVIIAKECHDTDSAIPVIDELARET